MGIRIKDRRLKLEFSIKNLSERIGVTSSLISQIEKGKAFPSIVTLKKVAEALSTTVGELIGENQNKVSLPLLKVENRRLAKENDNGTSAYMLSYHFQSKQIEPYIIKFKKGSNSEKIMTSNYPGQEFCFVVKGSFKATVGTDSYNLELGDSFYFSSNQNHKFENTSNLDAELLWVIQPTSK